MTSHKDAMVSMSDFLERIYECEDEDELLLRQFPRNERIAPLEFERRVALLIHDVSAIDHSEPLFLPCGVDFYVRFAIALRNKRGLYPVPLTLGGGPSSYADEARSIEYYSQSSFLLVSNYFPLVLIDHENNSLNLPAIDAKLTSLGFRRLSSEEADTRFRIPHRSRMEVTARNTFFYR